MTSLGKVAGEERIRLGQHGVAATRKRRGWRRKRVLFQSGRPGDHTRRNAAPKQGKVPHHHVDASLGAHLGSGRTVAGMLGSAQGANQAVERAAGNYTFNAAGWEQGNRALLPLGSEGTPREAAARPGRRKRKQNLRHGQTCTWHLGPDLFNEENIREFMRTDRVIKHWLAASACTRARRPCCRLAKSNFAVSFRFYLFIFFSLRALPSHRGERLLVLRLSGNASAL